MKVEFTGKNLFAPVAGPSNLRVGDYCHTGKHYLGVVTEVGDEGAIIKYADHSTGEFSFNDDCSLVASFFRGGSVGELELVAVSRAFMAQCGHLENW